MAQEEHLSEEHAAKGPQPAPAAVVDRIESRVWGGSKATKAAAAASASANANAKGKGTADAGSSSCRPHHTDDDKEECYVCLEEYRVRDRLGWQRHTWRVIEVQRCVVHRRPSTTAPEKGMLEED